MGKGADRKSFADVLREVESRPASPVLRRPGLHAGDFVDRDDRTYVLVTKGVSERRAFEAASAGAQLVWDPCGCGGYCGLEWYSEEDVRRMVESGHPSIPRKKRRQGQVSEWRSVDGSILLLAEDAVTWGDALG